MKYVNIAGINVPVYSGISKTQVRPSRLVETDTVRKNLQKILYPLLEKYPLLIVGDAGVGKNEMIYYINSKRNQPTNRFSFNEDTLPEDLIGTYRIGHENNHFIWTNGSMTRAMIESSTFVADEINLTPPHVLLRFASVYENRKIYLAEKDGSLIEAGNQFDFIATQNPREGFEGRKSLPLEIVKNFTIVSIDNFQPDELEFILKKLYPEIDNRLIQAGVEVCLHAENEILRGKLGKGDLEKYHFNLRTLKKIFLHILSYKNDSPADIFKLYFSDSFHKEEDKNYLDQLIQSILGEKEKKGVLSKKEAGAAVLNIPFPDTEKITQFTYKIRRLMDLGENILIEYSEEQPVNWLLESFMATTRNAVQWIQLSRGMNTYDLLGSLRPNGETVIWTDGSLTKAIKEGSHIILKGVESAGAEITEKLNMLTDDARAIQLSSESGMNEPLALDAKAVILALKPYRKNRSEQTISRAFRNRFTALQFPDLEDRKTLYEILFHYIAHSEIAEKMAEFHVRLKELAERKIIGAENLQPYRFGLYHLLRWKNHIVTYIDKDGQTALDRGVRLYYINEISAEGDRDKVVELYHDILPPEIFKKESSGNKKKTFTETSHLEREKWWENTQPPKQAERAAYSNSGEKLKKGAEIKTPETGGSIKEGKDAWYGKETRGNKGSGEPGSGGGAWGYRTEELYRQFLAKRKNILHYALDADYDEFKKVFEGLEKETRLNLEKIYDAENAMVRDYGFQGTSIHAGRYFQFLNGYGNEKIFNTRFVQKKDKGFKNLEIIFLLNQSRRIFNFDSFLATITALHVTTGLLRDHNIQYSVYRYFENKTGNLVFNLIDESALYTGEESEKKIYDTLSKNWDGDSLDEYIVLDTLTGTLPVDHKKRICIWISDFRNRRGKIRMEEELATNEMKILKKRLGEWENKIGMLGVGLGNRNIAESIFKNSVQINDDNFVHMPNVLGTALVDLMMRTYAGDF